MVNFSTFPVLSIVAPAANDDGHHEAGKARRIGLWKQIGKIFWAYAELHGAADTASFDGLL